MVLLMYAQDVSESREKAPKSSRFIMTEEAFESTKGTKEACLMKYGSSIDISRFIISESKIIKPALTIDIKGYTEDGYIMTDIEAENNNWLYKVGLEFGDTAGNWFYKTWTNNDGYRTYQEAYVAGSAELYNLASLIKKDEFVMEVPFEGWGTGKR